MKSVILGMITPGNGDISIGGFPQNRTGMIHVRQRCDGCEKHIERIAKSVDGVKKAEWNKNSNVLIVEFSPKKTSLKTVELAIAKAGHDTPSYKGSIKFYTQMPQCCQYRVELNDEKF